MASLVQAVTADADPATITFASAPAEGDLLVALQFQRAGTSQADFTAPAGWSGTGVAIDVALADGNYRRSCKVWYKIAGASEGTSYSFDDGTNNSKRVIAARFAPGAGETFGAPLTTAQNNDGTTTSTGNDIRFATGTTSSQSGKKLLVAGIAIKNNAGGSATTLDGWDTETLTSALFVDGGGNGRSGGLAYAQVDNTSTHGSTCQYDRGADGTLGHMAGIVVFPITTAAAHVPPDYEDEPPRQITRRALYALRDAWEPEEWLAAWAAALTSITASDTLAPGITDAVSAIAASLSAADTLAPGVTDALSNISASLAVADTVTVQVVDAAALLAALSAADTLAPGVTDAAAITVSALGKLRAVIVIRPALAAGVSAEAALGAATNVTPAIGGKPTLH